ncbi:MAG: anti-sigma factor [Gemmobacter sp.]
MTDTFSPAEEDEALAAEYVLGVQDAAERALVERRLRDDAAFARQVTGWENRLAGLNDGFAEAPAPALLAAIEARLFGRPEAPRRSLWPQWLLGAGLAAAVALAALFIVSPPPAPDAPLVATLAAEGQALVYAARYDAAAGELIVTRTAGEPAAATLVHELWLIAGTAAPVSLGLIETAELRRPLPVLPPGAVLAISLEPAGGSTTGAPTGPVLVTGAVTDL